MRNENLSRYYIQCSLSDHPEDWTDAAFWAKTETPHPGRYGRTAGHRPLDRKIIAPLRSFVTEPMRWGQLFLCGDAAHIVPPTGARGLNTAASDVHYTYQGSTLLRQCKPRRRTPIRNARWPASGKAERFSWWFSSLLHRYPDQSEFDLKMQQADIAFLRDNDAQQKAFAETIGLPY